MNGNYIIRAFYSAYNGKQYNKKRGKLLWKRFTELEVIGKRYLNRNASGKLKQHLHIFALSSYLQCLFGCF
nr:MAG TPA: hypothetical protein [Caudoviricetes sp.]